jgi:hypothetical protein
MKTEIRSMKEHISQIGQVNNLSKNAKDDE